MFGKVGTRVNLRLPYPLDERFLVVRISHGSAWGSSLSTIQTPELEGALKIRMKKSEADRLRHILGTSRQYLEFGCGGSTSLAVRSTTEKIYSVENSREWIETCKTDPLILRSVDEGRLHLQFVNVGPIGAWGYPKERESARLWPAYYLKIWDHLDAEAIDFVLVDGRWRVSCAIQALLRTRADCVIAVHDWTNDRPEYSSLLDFADVIDKTDTLVSLRRKSNIDWRALALEIPSYIFRTK